MALKYSEDFLQSDATPSISGKSSLRLSYPLHHPFEGTTEEDSLIYLRNLEYYSKNVLNNNPRISFLYYIYNPSSNDVYGYSINEQKNLIQIKENINLAMNLLSNSNEFTGNRLYLYSLLQTAFSFQVLKFHQLHCDTGFAQSIVSDAISNIIQYKKILDENYLYSFPNKECLSGEVMVFISEIKLQLLRLGFIYDFLNDRNWMDDDSLGSLEIAKNTLTEYSRLISIFFDRKLELEIFEEFDIQRERDIVNESVSKVMYEMELYYPYIEASYFIDGGWKLLKKTHSKSDVILKLLSYKDQLFNWIKYIADENNFSSSERLDISKPILDAFNVCFRAINNDKSFK